MCWHVGSVRWATSLHQDITTRKCYWYTYKHIMCSLLSSIHENNCFLFFKRYHMNIYPSATQKLPPTLWTISRASIARMSKSPRRGHIACEFWKIEDVAFIFSVYFMALIFLESMMLWQRKSQLPYCWLSGKLWYLQYHCVGDTICYH